MLLFHRTNAAEAILREGFRDGEGTHLTNHVFRGVWLSDAPLDVNEGAQGEQLLEVRISATQVRPYEWIEERKGYREWLVPAALLNAVAKVRLISPDEEDRIAVERSRRTDVDVTRRIAERRLENARQRPGGPTVGELMAVHGAAVRYALRDERHDAKSAWFYVWREIDVEWLDRWYEPPTPIHELARPTMLRFYQVRASVAADYLERALSEGNHLAVLERGLTPTGPVPLPRTWQAWRRQEIAKMGITASRLSFQDDYKEWKLSKALHAMARLQWDHPDPMNWYRELRAHLSASHLDRWELEQVPLIAAFFRRLASSSTPPAGSAG